MYNKFIITADGILRFGKVYLHIDLLKHGEECPYGGGLWEIDETIGAVLLYGRSFDFGMPCFEQIRQIEWEGLGGQALSLFYARSWPSKKSLTPIYICS